MGGIKRWRSGKSVIIADYFDDYDGNAGCDDEGDALIMMIAAVMIVAGMVDEKQNG